MPSSSPGGTAHKPRLRSLLLLALAGMVGMHAWVFFTLRQQVRQGYPDFTAFYAGGRLVRRGLGPQLYNMESQARVQQEFASGVKIRNGPLPFTHPPFEAAVFAPLALLSYSSAYWLWNAASLLALVGFLLLLRPHISQLRAWSEAVPFLAGLAFFPVFVCLLQGQDSLLLLLLFGLAFVAMMEAGGRLRVDGGGASRGFCRRGGLGAGAQVSPGTAADQPCARRSGYESEGDAQFAGRGFQLGRGRQFRPRADCLAIAGAGGIGRRAMEG